MTSCEEAAFRAGIAHAAEQARIAAITLEIRPDAMEMRQRAASEALRGFADGLRGEQFHDLPVKPPSGRSPQAEGTSPSREQALAAGYTGDACGTCQNFTLRRASACSACDSYSSTTGCS